MIIAYQDRENYDTRHGGAFDRGSADSYYNRPLEPHMFTGNTGSSDIIVMADMTPEQINDYRAGYEWNERYGDKKDYR